MYQIVRQDIQTETILASGLKAPCLSCLLMFSVHEACIKIIIHTDVSGDQSFYHFKIQCRPRGSCFIGKENEQNNASTLHAFSDKKFERDEAAVARVSPTLFPWWFRGVAQFLTFELWTWRAFSNILQNFSNEFKKCFTSLTFQKTTSAGLG